MFEIPAGMPLGYHQFQVRTGDEVSFCPLIVTRTACPR